MPTWPIEPHTRAKHEILRRYLKAWAPILGQGGFPRIVYIDGFAGPGIYDGGEDGSPAIALKAIGEAPIPPSTKVFLHFIEAKQEAAQSLQAVVSSMRSPPNFSIDVRVGAFEDEAPSILSQHALQARGGVPVFAFVDPFGWKGVPFDLIRRILEQSNAEVLINFMFEEINRFLGHPQQVENFDLFFGTQAWRDIVSIRNKAERDHKLRQLYESQLRDVAGAKFVRFFQMRNASNRIDYYLFFATNNFLGLKRMKEAMWKVDESGAFTFSDATDENQSVLFSSEPDQATLKRLLVKRFAGSEASISEIERFVVAETAFRETHFKKILKDLEIADPPQLTIINPKEARRRGTFPDGNMRVRFPPLA